MAKRGLMVVGAALQGIGAGITVHAESVRQKALRQMEIDAQNARDDKRMAYDAEQNRLTRENQNENTDKQIGAQQFNTMATLAGAQTRGREDNASREQISADDNAARVAVTERQIAATAADTAARRGLIVEKSVDAEGNVRGIAADGTVKDLGITEAVKEVSANSRLAVTTAITAATKTDPTSGLKSVDATQLAETLSQSDDKNVKAIGDMLKAGSPEAQQAAADELASLTEARETNEASTAAGAPTPTRRGLDPGESPAEAAPAPAGPAAEAQKQTGDEPPENAPAKPAQYPDAIWSKRANGWVIQQSNGKWAVVQ